MWANRDGFFVIFRIFDSIFVPFFGIFKERGGLVEKVSIASDRARQVLSESDVGLTWSNVWANPRGAESTRVRDRSVGEIFLFLRKSSLLLVEGTFPVANRGGNFYFNGRFCTSGESIQEILES